MNRVYDEDASSPWNYAAAFYKECAAQLANVSAERADMARYCHQNAMIARLAADGRDIGQSQEEAVERFAKFKSETPRQVVGRVYGSGKSAGEVILGEFDACLAPYWE